MRTRPAHIPAARVLCIHPATLHSQPSPVRIDIEGRAPQKSSMLNTIHSTEYVDHYLGGNETQIPSFPTLESRRPVPSNDKLGVSKKGLSPFASRPHPNGPLLA